MNLTIRPLSSDLLEDYLYFFDEVAFVDNPHWRGCYCTYYHFNVSNNEWIKRTKEYNREAAKTLIKEEKLSGYLAYIDNKPVGWCNVNLKANYSRLLSVKEIVEAEEGLSCSIVCFVIAPEYRGKGLASKILEQICKDYSHKDFDYIEAYPMKGDLSNAHQYHGPFSMYMNSGFTICKELDTYYIVKKNLKNNAL
ncbi:GNAT family N-acetyltransferase [Desnuesiella massiliensis]|uniref:GNAT family N-acetyltransferase n=1 Tax=Desnuesiella massiliensis TaxID=1650662 RepID=UPI0006E2F615|nr:GNAT family N-acetyltransferase [Desnuesiella massiliensis]